MRNKRRFIKRESNGITLIALVITIIVLLILAGVSIAMLTGENGILTQAQNAKNKTEEAEEMEKIQVATYSARLEDGDYKLTEENLQKEIDKEFGEGETRVYANEKDAFSIIFQNKESNFRIEKDGTINKIDIALKIYDADDLKAFMTEVNDGNTFENQYVYLMDNIDLENQTWNVIGSYTDDNNNQPFSGTFEGNNKTISGLSISKNQDYVGLFAYNIGTIRDVILESGSITGTGRVAGITALNAGIIENCHNKGVTINITGTSGGGGMAARSTGEITYCSNSVDITSQTASYIGGIVGALNYTNITNCYNTGNIQGVSNVGGIIGGNTGSMVKYCYNIGSIDGTGRDEAGGTYAGGIAGSVNSDKIIVCYNTGSIRGEYANVGGITGQLRNSAEVKDCYNIGVVESQEEHTGNIVGAVFANSIINNCYFSKEICDLNGVGYTNITTQQETIDKTMDYMKTSSFVNDLNKDEDAFAIFDSLNNGYPILEWQME